MSVYTTVTAEDLDRWLGHYRVGSLVDLKGIAAGIENTNYFVTTTSARFVLTLFEKLTPAELPFYLNLMAHLADRGLPCPKPVVADSGALFTELNGKPAALVTRLPGRSIERPGAHECAGLGALLARMHLAGRSYGGYLDNPRGPRWWRIAARDLQPFLDAARRQLLAAELDFQAGHRPFEGDAAGVELQRRAELGQEAFEPRHQLDALLARRFLARQLQHVLDDLAHPHRVLLDDGGELPVVLGQDGRLAQQLAGDQRQHGLSLGRQCRRIDACAAAERLQR